MTLQQILTISVLTFALKNVSFGQSQQSKQQLDKYLLQLKTLKVDTIIIVKSGCTGCEIKYNDTSKTVLDGQSVYVLIQNKGQFAIASFDDVHHQKNLTLDTCSLFDFINQNKSLLQQQKTFYDKELPKIKSKSGFYPPSPTHYSYDKLSIGLPNFIYDFEVIDNDKDHFGLKRDEEKWFIATKEIIKRVFNYSQSVND